MQYIVGAVAVDRSRFLNTALGTGKTADPVRIEIFRIVAPLARPIATPLRPYATVHAAVVRLRDSDGTEGCGYAVAHTPAALDGLVAALKRMAPLCDNMTGLINIERTEAAWPDASAHTRWAAHCFSLAVWDVLGKRLGVPCADLWGRAPGRGSLMAYASGLFFDRSADELANEAAGYRAQGYQLVKMRGGLAVAEDLAHYETVRQVFPEPARVAIDYVFQYDPQRTREFLAGAAAAPLWIEDPVGYDIIGRLGDLPCIAAGENCESTGALLQLRRDGVWHLILDVQMLGGPVRFLEAARALHALGCRVGSHLFAHESCHLLSVLPQSMPVEVLDWWNPLFDQMPQPDGDGRLAVEGPGLGRTLRADTLTRYGQAVG